MKLPTLSQFKRFGLKRRQEIFLQWAREQLPQKRYNSLSYTNCVLAQFGYALTARPCGAGNYSFFVGEDDIQILTERDMAWESPIHSQGDSGRTTFGALVRRLEKWT